jgi:hypothetical protein
MHPLPGEVTREGFAVWLASPAGKAWLAAESAHWGDVLGRNDWAMGQCQQQSKAWRDCMLAITQPDEVSVCNRR